MNRSKKINTKDIVLSGLFIALGVLIPIFFHTVNLGGPTFLPMHIPVLLAGFTVNPAYALLVGILTPLLSSLFTGMPPIFPMGVIMIFELGAYGFISSIIYRETRENVILSLIISLIGGRIVAGLVVAVLFYILGTAIANPINFIWGGIITGIPGIIIQLALIPGIMLLLSKSTLLRR